MNHLIKIILVIILIGGITVYTYNNANGIPWHLGLTDKKELEKWSTTSKNILSKIKNYKLDIPELYHGYDSYRLADTVTQLRYFPDQIKNFPDSLATKYLKRTFLPSNYEVLWEIINEINSKNPVEKPPEDVIVVHLRVGDVCDSQFTKSTSNHYYNPKQPELHHILSTVTTNGYMMPLKYYYLKLKKLQNLTNSKKIILVCASHHKLSKNNFCYDYIKAVKYHLEKYLKYKVTIRAGKNPDIDFMYMCYSKYFIKSRGGFSTLVEDMINVRG